MSDVATLLLCDPVLTRYAAAEVWPSEEQRDTTTPAPHDTTTPV